MDTPNEKEPADIPDELQTTIKKYESACNDLKAKMQDSQAFLSAAKKTLITSTPVASDIKWARHLWKEWKYRHDHKWRTLYRGLGAIAVAATVPWLKPAVFNGRVVQGGWILLVFLMFGGMCVGAAVEYAELQQVGKKLEAARGSYCPEKRSGWFAFSSSGRWAPIWFIVIFILFFVLWGWKLLTM